MRFLYSRWRPDSVTDEGRLRQLMTLFSYLVVATSGNVAQALDWLREIAKQHGLFDESLSVEELLTMLRERGIIEEIDGRVVLTTKGIQQIRKDALREIFTSLRKGPGGTHETAHTGRGVERTNETRGFTYGDSPTNIDLTATLTNVFRRGGIEEFSLEEGDLEVYETEHQVACATVLMIDVSHSMILYGEDRITPAKQVALALSELITTRFPKDYLAIATFGDEAQLITAGELPFLTAGPYHTNTRAGLQLARNLLRRRGNADKQIFMITDGKPSAIVEPDGRLYKNAFGLDPKIVNKTLDEAVACRREQIVITTFMVAREPSLVRFVDELTRANKGRAYYSSLATLGEFLFVDYIRNRRKKFTGR